ncbi:MAG TPA: pseudouridine-5'-phosphate glycosidase [Blastocatellia bacterium]|nr:pseudouridine-5'-phosphate glycosidase [Blastocatellia bacterium]
MSDRDSKLIEVAEPVALALEERRPVVALESTVIAHGLPRLVNLETARACEAIIREAGAVPATIGVIAGRMKIGLTDDELSVFAAGETPSGETIHKVSPSNVAGVLLRRGWGATTVAASLRIAYQAGLRVLATGGFGGVHRGASGSFDESADLMALATTPMVCVSAGAKAILDLPKTIERLETLGTPVVGYGSAEFAAFYSRGSGLPVDVVVDTPDEVADLARLHWESGATTAVLVSAPVPEEFAIPSAVVEKAIEQAVEEAERSGVRGKALTPFLLSRLEEITEGRTLDANRALLVNNAGIAARIAAIVARLG